MTLRLTFEIDASADASSRLKQLNASLEKELKTLEAFNLQKKEMESIQNKLDENIEKNKELLRSAHQENETIQKDLDVLKKELFEHNQTFESHSKVFSTKVNRIFKFCRNRMWNVFKLKRSLS